MGSIPTRLRQLLPPCRLKGLQGGHFFGHTLGHLFEGFSGLGLVLAQPLPRLSSAVDQVGGAVLPVRLRDMQRAFELVERHGDAIVARDAVHAATMLNNGLTRLFSADTHFDAIAGTTRVDPRKATRR